MKGENLEKHLTECQPAGNNPTNIDPPPKECEDDNWPSQKRVLTNPPDAWTARKTFKKVGPPFGCGQHALCDPIQTGQIVNDLDTPNRQVIYRYAKGIRCADEAMWDMFKNVIVIDEEGKEHIVPIIWASQEKAVAALLQDNVRKDNSLVVDRIRLPIMSIWNNSIQFDQSRFTYQQAYSLMPWIDPEGQFGFHQREKFCKDTVFGVTRGIPVNIGYTLYVWTLYQEDMNQILEQVLLKFSPVAYIRMRGVWWEVIVTLDSTGNNAELEPGDAKIRVLKYQINMTAKTYIPQPIFRIKELEPSLCELKNAGDEETLAIVKKLKKTIKEFEETINI